MITADKCLNKDRNAEVDVLKMEQLKALAQELRDHFKRKRLVESSRAFVQILHDLTEFISSLQTVYTMCSSSASKDSCISPGVLDNDFEQMKASKDLIGKRIQEFKLSNFTNPVNPLEWDFLTNVNSILLNCSLCRCCCKAEDQRNELGSYTVSERPTYRPYGASSQIQANQLNSNFRVPFPTNGLQTILESERRAEEDHQRKLDEQNKRRENRNNAFLRELNRGDSDRERKRRRKEEDENAAFEEERFQRRMQNEHKNREMYRDAVTGNGYNANEWEERLERQRTEFDAQRRDLESGMRENQMRHEREMAEKDRNGRREEEEHQERMRKIDEKLARKLEELLRNAEERRAEMSAQFEQISKILQMRVWNEIIESNWTNRLNTLRNSNKDSERMERYCLRSNSDASQYSEWRQVLEILLNFMNTESENMSIMYRNTGKSFLLVIQSSVDKVSRKCEELLDALQTADARNLKALSSDLNEACRAIPTLAKLKRQYYSEMND
ncbi:unnamed protein product [Caenorhabditis sp. 36 PRJEB53466]|nr:unnamed protein product [Caenorhabditis sp. 36 PRJEB53466]